MIQHFKLNHSGFATLTIADHVTLWYPNNNNNNKKYATPALQKYCRFIPKELLSHHHISQKEKSVPFCRSVK